MRTAAFAFASLVASLTLSPAASPQAPRKHPMTAHAATIGPASLRFGRSIGSPTDGRLVGGAHLEEAAYLRIVPVYATGDARWGLEPLVAMLDRAARAVRKRFADATLSVGHLSRPGGGDIDRHRSHESGRDADVSFFVRSASGKQLLASHFVAFEADGTAPTWPGAFFDDAKNWTLVSALVSDPEAHVTHLFVAAPLRARLLAYAERIGAPAALRVRAAEAMQQPHGALPHDDHFHVRIGCPAHMSGCVENPAARAGRPPVGLALHGRRGGAPAQPWITSPAKHATHNESPAPNELEAPARPLNREPEKGDVPDEPAAPPASIVAPIDDVDG